ncbi:hypothetical protein GGX14DRAFT_574000 [Mycena pura]|uniref:Uncharacterized protein n=1 Tax=Mycena pura TaxID=153505 RepID=A0AAD6V2C0_9AGAR|nr:hypothetical protein GGX14DRAFT_574000 [Mycena pura]
MSLDFPLDAMPWIAVDHRLAPLGDFLRITGILSFVSAQCPFCWSSHPSPHIPILFLDALRSLLLVRIFEIPRGFTELRIPAAFLHVNLCSQDDDSAPGDAVYVDSGTEPDDSDASDAADTDGPRKAKNVKKHVRKKQRTDVSSSQARSDLGLPDSNEVDANGMLKSVRVQMMEDDVDENAPLNNSKPSADVGYFFPKNQKREAVVKGKTTQKYYSECSVCKSELVSDHSTLRRHLGAKHKPKYLEYCKTHNFLSMLLYYFDHLFR